MRNIAVVILFACLASAQTTSTVLARGSYLDDNLLIATSYAYDIAANKLANQCEGKLSDIKSNVYCYKSRVSNAIDCTVRMAAQCEEK
jgi:hypothetical protein